MNDDGTVQRLPKCWRRRLVSACFLILAPQAMAVAQVIEVRPVPLADGDQFGFLPTANVGMAGVSIAVADTLLDPFRNPGMAVRLQRGVLFGAPTVYSVSRNTGGGRTLPLGAVFRSGSSFAGFAAAIQEVTPAGVAGGDVFPVNAVAEPSVGLIETGEPAIRSNQYLSAIAGRMVGGGVSLGASAMWSRLAAVDGVDLLYLGNRGLTQSGDAIDIRIGAVKDWSAGRSLEAVLVHRRFELGHDVLFMDQLWDPGSRQMLETPRSEHNFDRTVTSGMHVEYEQPVAGTGWRLGGLLTANRISHPDLPDYAFANVPRDAGHSSAFNLGVGISKSDGLAQAGIDLIYEPIWTTSASASVENRFAFDNALVRVGLSRDFPIWTPGGSTGRQSAVRVQLGMQLRSVSYDLERRDVASSATTVGSKSWKEWTRTAGAVLRLPEFDFHYRLRITNGVGRPEVQFFAWPGPEFLSLNAPPPGAQTLQPVRVLTQQLSVSIPIR